MLALHTDLYELTMSAGYFGEGMTGAVATFEMFVRRYPYNRDRLLFCGVPQAIEYLENLRFTDDQIAYLRKLPQLANADPGFWDYLAKFRFTGDVDAMQEGTLFFIDEPVMRVRAPIIEAQILETCLLALLSFESLIASKAIRVVEAAQGRPVIEFGTRRAHSPEAGVLAGRAAYVAGCAGTSNVECGFRYGVPVYGTSAHSWVMAFPNETKSYRALQRLLGDQTVYLVDTYDTVEGVRRAASIGPPLWGVRLDSGDTVALSKEVRKVLDEGGFPNSKIMASGDLNEVKMKQMLDAGAQIDVFGVGTELATSSDSPNLSAVYKLVEIEHAHERRFTMKGSTGKQTAPGAKQVYRYAGHDEITLASESREGAEALLKPLFREGKLVNAVEPIADARARAVHNLATIRAGRKVSVSPALRALQDAEREKQMGAMQ